MLGTLTDTATDHLVLVHYRRHVLDRHGLAAHVTWKLTYGTAVLPYFVVLFAELDSLCQFSTIS